MLAFVHRLPCREDDSVTAKDLSKVSACVLAGCRNYSLCVPAVKSDWIKAVAFHLTIAVLQHYHINKYSLTSAWSLFGFGLYMDTGDVGGWEAPV